MILFFFFGSRRQVKRAAFLILLFQAFEFIFVFPSIRQFSFVVRRSTFDNRQSAFFSPSPHTRKPVETA